MLKNALFLGWDRGSHRHPYPLIHPRICCGQRQPDFTPTMRQTDFKPYARQDKTGPSAGLFCFCLRRCATAKARAGTNYVSAPRTYTARFYSAMGYFAGMFSPRVMEDAKDLALKYFKIAKKNEKRPGKYKKSMGDAEVKGYARMRKAMLEREKRLTGSEANNEISNQESKNKDGGGLPG